MPPDLGGILALDLSSTVGYAAGACDAPRPVFGCWELPPIGGEGARYAAFRKCLTGAMQQFTPARLILEAPLSFQALVGISTAKIVQQQYGLRTIAYMLAYDAKVPCQEVSADIVRLALLGQSRFAKGQVKSEVKAYCRGRGWRVPDDNAADACMIWLWLVNQLTGTRPVAGPLFRQREKQSL